jgi:uncharacterized protein YacL
MSVDFVFRLIGMVVFALLLGWVGALLADPLEGQRLVFTVILGLVGALMGLILTPYVTLVPLRRMKDAFREMPIHRLIAILIGLVVGLIAGALIALPLSLLPDPFGQFLPLVGALFFGYLGVVVMSMRQGDVVGFIQQRSGNYMNRLNGGRSGGWERGVLLDTSVIIDGRIADISQTGFISGPMIVPNFVLNELQHVADSADTLRRNRGRRGLDLLNRLQRDSLVPVQITDMDAPGVLVVDDKLVILAKQLHCPILTNDYNLNKVAELQGVAVLNINELANAVRAVYLPGEDLTVRIIQEGKERDQGVGYLEDGTMVVVENGENYIDQTIDTIVTKVLQTAAGRMIFSRPADQME